LKIQSNLKISKNHLEEVEELHETAVYDLTRAGGKHFYGLLNTPDSQLGWSIPNVQLESNTFKLNRVLGQGASAVVFGGEWKTDNNTVRDVVVKWFRNGQNDECLKRELRFLDKVKDLYPKVPRVCGLSDDKTSIILEPIGQHFAYQMDDIHEVTFLQLMDRSNETQLALPTANDFCMLLDIIAAIHKANIVHRDIKPSNFFKHNNQVL
jgi:tRNA A-37 threonylcarbamoyl transferase component Bud32